MSSVVTRSSASRGGLSAQDRRIVAATSAIMPYNPAPSAPQVVVKCRHFFREKGRFCPKECRTAKQKQLKRCKTHEDELQLPEQALVIKTLEAHVRAEQYADAVEDMAAMVAATGVSRGNVETATARLQERYPGATIDEIYSQLSVSLASLQRAVGPVASSGGTGTGTGASRRRPRPDDEFDAEEAELRRPVKAMRVEDDDDLAAPCSSLHIAPQRLHPDDAAWLSPGEAAGGGDDDEMPVDIVY